VELLGQRAHCLGEQRQALRGDGELAALGAHDHARHVDDIAQVQVLQQSPVLLAHLVDAAEELNLGGGVAHHHEGDLALAALGHDAATDAHHVIGVFACLEVGILGLDVDDMRRNLGMLRIRIAAGLHDGSALGQAMGALVIQRRHRLRRVLRALLRLTHILLLLAICGPHVPRTSCKTRCDPAATANRVASVRPRCDRKPNCLDTAPPAPRTKKLPEASRSQGACIRLCARPGA